MSRPFDFSTPIPRMMGPLDRHQNALAIQGQEQTQQLNALAIRAQQGDLEARNALATALQGQYETPEARSNALMAADPFAATDILGAEQDRALRESQMGLQRDQLGLQREQFGLDQEASVEQGREALSKRMLEAIQVARARPQGDRLNVFRTYLSDTPMAGLFDEDTETTDEALDAALTQLIGPIEVTAGASLMSQGGGLMGTAPEPPDMSARPTVQTAEGIRQWNPDTQRYDIPVGGLPPTSRPAGGTVPGLPEDLPSDWRNVMERALMAIQVPSRRAAPMALMSRLWEEGDTDELRGVVKTSIINNLNVAQKNEVMGREGAIVALDAIDGLIDEMRDQGIDTNILTGSFEDVERRLGTTSDPKLVEFKNRILPALMAYRLSVTGVQFSQQESLQYQALYPNYGQTYTVNKAAIRGLRDGMNVSNDHFWQQMLGPTGAQLIGAGSAAPPGPPGATSPADPLGILGP